MERLIAIWVLGPGLCAVVGLAAPLLAAAVLLATCLSLAVLDEQATDDAPARRGMLRA